LCYCTAACSGETDCASCLETECWWCWTADGGLCSDPTDPPECDGFNLITPHENEATVFVEQCLPPAAQSCYISAYSAMYLGCGTQTDDVVSQGVIIADGNNLIRGNLLAPNARIGDCSEILGDLETVHRANVGEDVFVKGTVIQSYQLDVVPGALSPPNFQNLKPGKTDYVVPANTVVLITDSPLPRYRNFNVSKGGVLVLSGTTVTAENIFVDSGATIVLEGSLDSILITTQDILFGNYVSVQGGTLSLESEGDITIGKKLCGIENFFDEDGSSSSSSSSSSREELEERWEKRADSCDCDEITTSDEFLCYCELPAQVRLLSSGTVSVGSYSYVEGEINTNVLIVGDRTCLSCQ